jgi:hypothetical protein
MEEDIARFIQAQPATVGYEQLARECRAMFGERAPSADAIREWWLIGGEAVSSRDRIGRDREVALRIADMAGRMPVPDILRVLQGEFPASRVPPRSTLYRYVNRLTARAAVGGLRRQGAGLARTRE